MENIEKHRIEQAVRRACEDSFEEIRDILEKHNITLRTNDFNEIAEFVTRMLESKARWPN